MNLIFLTSNQNKLNEAQDILGNSVEISGQKVDLDEIQSVNVNEVIRHKIKQAKKILHDRMFFVEDIALYLGAGKEIGALIKYFNNERVARAYLGEPAQAVCLIGLSNGKIFTGKIDGTVVAPRGQSGFGWDPIFQPQGFDKTFAQMNPKEKNSLSMRKNALEELKKYLPSVDTNIK